ncbi:MAG: MmgE/PrpD family protein, partial [Candidatus Omnitrophica bacterium]|nr:MmgE/PrpD family protein [Candidatus Omnitrophota bacterium]
LDKHWRKVPEFTDYYRYMSEDAATRFAMLKTGEADIIGLNPEQIACALGIAGSEASGLRENFGTATKPFHAGQASAKGLKAAWILKSPIKTNPRFEK